MVMGRGRKVSHSRKRFSAAGEGGLLIFLWVEPGSLSQGQLNCTVAAAGVWCAGTTLKEVEQEFGLKSGPSALSCPAPDPGELCAFTELYGPLSILLSFKVRGGTDVAPEECSQVESFLHRFSRTNAGLKIHFKLMTFKRTYQKIYSGTWLSKMVLKDQQTVILDVTCDSLSPPLCIGQRPWCQGGHPVPWGGLPLSIPTEAIEKGLYGELSLQPVTLLSPCVRQYPNLATRLKHIQVLAYGPTNLPLLGSSAFLQQLLTWFDCQDLGIAVLSCKPSPTSPDPLGSGTVYTVVSVNPEEPESEWTPAVEQSLSLFLFLHHNDPFHSQLSDFVATEELLEHHLEDILTHNRQAVTAALHTVLKNALADHRQRSKTQEKTRSALREMLSSVGCVVSSSSNAEFRTACLDCMKVQDTHGLSASLFEALKRVSSSKHAPSVSCYSDNAVSRLGNGTTCRET